jgi:hypothetical protein
MGGLPPARRGDPGLPRIARPRLTPAARGLRPPHGGRSLKAPSQRVVCTRCPDAVSRQCSTGRVQDRRGLDPGAPPRQLNQPPISQRQPVESGNTWRRGWRLMRAAMGDLRLPNLGAESRRPSVPISRVCPHAAEELLPRAGQRLPDGMPPRRITLDGDLHGFIDGRLPARVLVTISLPCSRWSMSTGLLGMHVATPGRGAAGSGHDLTPFATRACPCDWRMCGVVRIPGRGQPGPRREHRHGCPPREWRTRRGGAG